MADMIWWILLGWCLISVPVGMLVGPRLRDRQPPLAYGVRYIGYECGVGGSEDGPVEASQSLPCRHCEPSGFLTSSRP